MADRKTPPADPKEKPLEGDREAGLIHDLATAPPGKDMASVKAASDVFEANRDRPISGRRAPAHS